jgi:hypothetical protein
MVEGFVSLENSGASHRFLPDRRGLDTCARLIG